MLSIFILEVFEFSCYCVIMHIAFAAMHTKLLQRQNGCHGIQSISNRIVLQSMSLDVQVEYKYIGSYNSDCILYRIGR